MPSCEGVGEGFALRMGLRWVRACVVESFLSWGGGIMMETRRSSGVLSPLLSVDAGLICNTTRVTGDYCEQKNETQDHPRHLKTMIFHTKAMFSDVSSYRRHA